MRLGDVLSETDETTDEAPPKARRRFGLWIALWLLLGLGALSWAHGPVVLFPQPGEAVVLYSPEGWGIFGPSVRTITDQPFVIRLPLLQRYARMSTLERAVEVDAQPTASGVSIRLAGGRVVHRVRAADASEVALTLGVDPEARDALVADITRATWAEAIADLDVAELADPARVAARLEAAGKQLADRAAEHGIDARLDARPAVEVNPEVAGLLARIGEVESQLHDRETGAGQQVARQREDQAALERRHRAEVAAARARVQTRLVEASTTLAQAGIAAERAYQSRLATARVEQHTLAAVARSIEAEADAEAAAARARVEAIGQNGPRILDHVIATHVMPQLERIRTGGSPLPGPLAGPMRGLSVMPEPPPPAAIATARPPAPPVELTPDGPNDVADTGTAEPKGAEEVQP